MRIVRQLIDSSTRAGGDWQSIIEGVRQAMPALWSDLPDADRARFLRHVRLWWDIHRHRAPRQTLEQIEDLRRSHRLSVHAGRLLGFSPKGPRLGLIWRARGTTQICQDDADVVVNVTGPDTDPRRSSCPLVRSLLAQGLARADQHGLGWSTTRDGRMLTARGEPSATLFYVGPLLRASLWEATAVPELRDHVDRTADALAESLTRRLRYTDGTFRSPAVHGVR